MENARMIQIIRGLVDICDCADVDRDDLIDRLQLAEDEQDELRIYGNEEE